MKRDRSHEIEYRGVFLALCLAVVLVLGLAACGQKASDDFHEEAAWSTAEPWSGLSPQPPTLFPAREDGMWGFIDKSGQVVVDYQYDYADEFSEGLAAVRSGSRWGYIDENGSFVIAPQYSSAGPFSCGLARVDTTSDDGSGGATYVDVSGNPVFDRSWGDSGYYSEGLAGVSFFDDESSGFIDMSGDLVILLPGVDSVGPFSEGLAGIDGGYIDRDANLVIKGDFIHPTEFSGGLAVVLVWPGYAIIDTSGQVVADLDYLEARPLSEGLAAVSTADGWGYVDVSGTLTIPIQFWDAEEFHGGLAWVEYADGKMGYVDTKGDSVWREK